jgi:predicted lipoprotein with Yx(FWY)xxD motif
VKSGRWAVVVAGLAVGAAACGAGGAGTATAAHVNSNRIDAASAASARSGKAVVVKTRKVSPYGTILTTSAGRTLYIFSDDSKGKSHCSGGCATEWPPLIVAKGDSVSGVAGLGTIKRSDGSDQVALRGQALYRFAGDTAPGKVTGQGDDGDWFVATPSGASHAKPVTVKPTPTKSSPPSGGGYGY